MCSLNTNIPSNVTVEWRHNGSTILATSPNTTIQTAGRTSTLLIENIQPSDAGIYQCAFTDAFNNWTLTRNIILVVPGMNYNCVAKY